MDIQILDMINVLSPAIAGVAGWFFGRRKQKNDFLGDLQASIDLLAEKNKELLAEVVALRSENAKLRMEVEKLTVAWTALKQLPKKVKVDETV